MYDSAMPSRMAKSHKPILCPAQTSLGVKARPAKKLVVPRTDTQTGTRNIINTGEHPSSEPNPQPQPPPTLDNSISSRNGGEAYCASFFPGASRHSQCTAAAKRYV